jgi:hypothetical protein
VICKVQRVFPTIKLENSGIVPQQERVEAITGLD